MADDDASKSPPTPNDADATADVQDAGELAEQALADAESAAGALNDAAADGSAEGAGDGRNVDLPNFQQVLADVEASGLDLLHDVELHVKIELGRTSMVVEDVLRLAEGSVVELDKLAGDPVDVFVNERLVARGEVLVLNDNFCVRVSEIVGDPAEEQGHTPAADSEASTQDKTQEAPA